jgi:nitroreductase
MDSSAEMSAADFFRIIRMTLPAGGRAPFAALPWNPEANLVLFVHRVKGLSRGLYILVRAQHERENIVRAFREEFEWKKPEGCPEELEFYLLAAGDLGEVSKSLSCHQDIASDGCFSLGTLVRFENALKEYGSWFYPRLYWECGMIGHVLYLEAEACGMRGTGIGCFFDDAVHSLLGLEDIGYQSLYHFTVGKPVLDRRVMTLPAYPPRSDGGAER